MPAKPANDPRSSSVEDDPVEASRMTLSEHLNELRQRLVRATAAFAVAFVVLWTFRSDVSLFITRPFDQAIGWLNADLVDIYSARVDGLAEPASEYFEAGYPEVKVIKESKLLRSDLTYLGFGSNMVMKLRVCFWLSMLLAGPFALYQVWAFVAAGLYRSERKIVYSYFPASVGLFVGGVAFGFFVMIPYAAYFLSKEGLGEPGYPLNVTSDQYIEFIKGLSLAIGVVFQLPLVQFVLARLGLVDPALYSKFRGHTAVVTLIVAAVLTPPDPVTQIMLAAPALILYEIGAALSRLVWVPVPGAVERTGDSASAPV
ncbi:MAG: twin-arginine translocase subunit TatC [Planctomycetota bacterium]